MTRYLPVDSFQKLEGKVFVVTGLTLGSIVSPRLADRARWSEWHWRRLCASLL